MRLLNTDNPNDAALQFEINEINASLKMEEEIGQSSYADCFRDGGNSIRFRTLTAIFLQAWQQLTGVNFIFYYGTFFFKSSGISKPFIQSIATNVVNVGMTVPGIWLVERAGRRKMLLIGAAGMLVCEYIVAIVGVTVKDTNLAGQKVLVAFVCIYIVSGCVAWFYGPCDMIGSFAKRMLTYLPFCRRSSLPPGARLHGLSLARSSPVS